MGSSSSGATAGPAELDLRPSPCWCVRVGDPLTDKDICSHKPPSPAIRALRALGLDHVTLSSGGVSFRPDSWSGHIDIDVDARVEPHEGGSSLTVITRFSATDEQTHERLLDAWPLVSPLVSGLVKRAARTAKHCAEGDHFEDAETVGEYATAA